MSLGVLITLAVAFAATAFLSCAIAALRHFSHAHLDDRILRGPRRRQVDRALARRERLLLACQVLHSFFSLLFITMLAAGQLPGIRAGRPLLLALAILIGECILILFLLGRVVPGALGRSRPEGVLLAVLPVITKLEAALRPLTTTVEFLARLAQRIGGVPPRPENGAEEILAAASEVEKEGEIEKEQKEMIENIVDFHDVDVSEIMTARTDMVTIAANATGEEARRLITEKGFSRVPVFQGNQDNIIGVLYAKDLLGRPASDSARPKLTEIMRQPFFVPETKQISELLRDFRRQKVHLAVVLDEYGGTAGLVTIEDIVEEVFGEILDEYDEDAGAPLRLIDEDTAEFVGQLPVDELNEALRIHLPEDSDFETVGGFLFSTLGTIPPPGQVVRVEPLGRTLDTAPREQITFTILQANARRILRVRAHVERAEESSE